MTTTMALRQPAGGVHIFVEIDGDVFVVVAGDVVLRAQKSPKTMLSGEQREENEDAAENLAG